MIDPVVHNRRKTDPRIEEMVERQCRMELAIAAILATTANYTAYLDVAMKREKVRSAFVKAIIEKSLAALIWSVVIGACILFFDGLKSWIATLK